jgi:acyl carrier protein
VQTGASDGNEAGPRVVPAGLSVAPTRLADHVSPGICSLDGLDGLGVVEEPLTDRESLEAELKELIVEALALEDIAPEEIETGAPLFVEGLGLDSIDALELAMALEERFGVKIGEDPDENQRIFTSVQSLAGFVEENRVR